MPNGGTVPDGFVLAIDFGGTKIAVGSAGTDGELLFAERLETHAENGAEQAVERAIEAALQLADRTRDLGRGDCLAAGAVSPGIVEEQGVFLAPNVPGWDGLALPALLRDGLGMASVAVANDVNAAAVADARWGRPAHTHVRPFLCPRTGGKRV